MEMMKTLLSTAAILFAATAAQAACTAPGTGHFGTVLAGDQTLTHTADPLGGGGLGTGAVVTTNCSWFAVPPMKKADGTTATFGGEDNIIWLYTGSNPGYSGSVLIDLDTTAFPLKLNNNYAHAHCVFSPATTADVYVAGYPAPAWHSKSTAYEGRQNNTNSPDVYSDLTLDPDSIEVIWQGGQDHTLDAWTTYAIHIFCRTKYFTAGT